MNSLVLHVFFPLCGNWHGGVVEQGRLDPADDGGIGDGEAKGWKELGSW